MPHFSPVVRMCAHGCPVIASSKLICLPQSRVTGPSVSHNRKTTPSYAHTESHLPYSQMGLCPPSPDKLSLGLQINIQAKQRLYIIESWCHECTTGATLDAVTMCAPTHRDTHTHSNINTWLPAALTILSAGWGQDMNTQSQLCMHHTLFYGGFVFFYL